MSSTKKAFKASSLKDWPAKFRHFLSVVEENGELWALLNSEESFQKMRWATLDLNLPAVAGVVKQCAPYVKKAAPAKRKDWLKKAIGAMVCVVMENNEFETTGQKKAVPPVPERVFRVGEFYQPKREN